MNAKMALRIAGLCIALLGTGMSIAGAARGRADPVNDWSNESTADDAGEGGNVTDVDSDNEANGHVRVDLLAPV